MMKFLFVFLCVTLFIPAQAFSSTSDSDPEFELSLDEDVYPLKEFQSGKGIKVNAMPRKSAKTAIPDKETREDAFAKVPGLEKEIEKFDQLSRDKLYVHARTKTLKKLQKTYPLIPASTLRQLQKELKAD